MNYDQKNGGKGQIGNLTPNHKSLENRGQMKLNWGVFYTVGKIFLMAIRYYLQIFKKKTYFEKDMRVQSSRTTRVPILGLPLGSFGEK
jgi:hypothetical protein